MHTAANATDLPEFVLPHVDGWSLLLSCHHRTLPGLQGHERPVLRFVRAQYAVMALRGLDTEPLLREVVVGDRTVKKQEYRDVSTSIMHCCTQTRSAARRLKSVSNWT